MTRPDSSPAPVDTARITALIAAYGADPSRWPPAERDAHAAAAARAATALRDAAALDAMLATLEETPAVSTDLRRRVLLAVAAQPRPAARGIGAALRELWRELGGARIAGPALALAMVVGLGLGWATTPAVAEAGETEDLLAIAQFEDTYEEFNP
jgi:hypothetical protein